MDPKALAYVPLFIRMYSLLSRQTVHSHRYVSTGLRDDLRCTGHEADIVKEIWRPISPIPMLIGQVTEEKYGIEGLIGL